LIEVSIRRPEGRFVVATIKLAIYVGRHKAGLPSFDLVGHAVERSEAGLGVCVAIAGVVVNGAVLVAVDSGIEPCDQTLDLVACSPADAAEGLEKGFRGNVGPSV